MNPDIDFSESDFSNVNFGSNIDFSKDWYSEHDDYSNILKRNGTINDEHDENDEDVKRYNYHKNNEAGLLVSKVYAGNIYNLSFAKQLIWNPH